MEKLNNLGAVCTAGSLRTALPALREPRRRPRSVPPRHRGRRWSLRGPGLVTATIPGVGVDGDGESPECHLTPASARAWPWWDAGILRHSPEGVWEVPVRGMLALRRGKYLETRLKSTLALVGWWDGAVAMGCGVAEPTGPKLDGHRCPGASGSGSIPSQLRECLLPPEQGMWIGLQDTGTGTRPKFSPMAPCGSCPALPLSPRGMTLGSGCPRRRRNRWKTGLNVPGVKSIAGHGHARNQPSNRINGERSCWKGSVGTCAPGALPCHPPAPGAALSPFPEVGGTPRQGWGSWGGLALAAPQLNFHRVVFNSPGEGGRAGGGGG